MAGPTPDPNADPGAEVPEEAQKAIALEAILGAWDMALGKGVEPEYLASAAIFAALADMVELYGAEAVAQMCAELPDRVRSGAFTFAEAAGGPTNPA